jgi:hypothetical protein
VSAAHPDVVARLKEGLDRAIGAAGEAESRRAPDPEAAEKLRALGYVQGPFGPGLEGRSQGHGGRGHAHRARGRALPRHAAAAAAYRPIACAIRPTRS